MFRLFTTSLVFRASFHPKPLRSVPVLRNFSSAAPLYKKEKGAKGATKDKRSQSQEEPVEQEEDPSIILKALEEQYKDALAHFKEKIAITKQGKSNPHIFDDLKVTLNHHEEVSYLSVAQTAIKGRNLIITVFDPAYSKHVISAIMQTGQNLNPEPVPNFPQQLKVSLPPVTRETKLEILKELKKNLEFFKNSNSSKHSLASKRAHALKELKEFKKNDQIKKITNDVEKLHKKYTNDLQELFKNAEKQIIT